MSDTKDDPQDPKDPTDLNRYYAQRAQEYDRVYLKPERQADLRAIEAWLPTVLARRRVLEVACGTGYWTQFIAPVAERMSCVDAAVETLAIARHRVRHPSVQWHVGDAYQLPALTPLPDAAFAGFWWSHIPLERVGAFLDGLHAALEPGATVVFIDNRFVPGSSTPIAETDAQGNTFQQRRLGDGSLHRVLKNFPTRAALAHAVQGRAVDVNYREWPHFWGLHYLRP